MKRVRPYTIEDAAQFVPFWNFGFVREPDADHGPLSFGVNLPGGTETEAQEEAWTYVERAFEEQFPGEPFMRSEWHHARRPRVINGN